MDENLPESLGFCLVMTGTRANMRDVHISRRQLKSCESSCKPYAMGVSNNTMQLQAAGAGMLALVPVVTRQNPGQTSGR